MKRRYIIIGIINAVSLLAYAAVTVYASALAGTLDSQHTVERWVSDDGRYAQVSVFSGEVKSMDINTVFMTRINVDKKLTEDSTEPMNNGVRVWADCFSAPCGKINVMADSRSADTELTVTGGDFFLFHPLELVSGDYYSDGDLMHDKVLIDDVAAWQLYGSSDINGLPLLIGGKYFIISGVYKHTENSYEKKVYGNLPRIFMHYDGYELIGGTPMFSCYEACLPDPVSGRALQIIRNVFSIDENSTDIYTVENSARYGIRNRFSLMKNKNMRSVVNAAVVYPYWENAARMTEDRSVSLLELQTAFLILPVGTVVYIAVTLYRKRRLIFNKFLDAAKAVFNKFKRIKTNISRKEIILK